MDGEDRQPEAEGDEDPSEEECGPPAEAKREDDTADEPGEETNLDDPAGRLVAPCRGEKKFVGDHLEILPRLG